jgi:PHO85 cyclin-1
MFDVREINLMERQLLFLLDYDLRFNEFEACLAFAPLMPAASRVSVPHPVPNSSIQQQNQHMARIEAVKKVARAGKARALARAPAISPLPPPYEAVQRSPQPATTSAGPATVSTTAKSMGTSTGSSAGLAKTVYGIAKRLSATHLRHSHIYSSSHASTPSTGSAAESVTSESEMGGLTDDSGCSSSSSSSAASEYGENEEEAGSRLAGKKAFSGIGRGAPSVGGTCGYPYAHMARSRIPSDTSSIRSNATVKGANNNDGGSPRRTTGTHRGSLHARTRSCRGDDQPTSTAPSVLRSVGSSSSFATSSGFLSRMWGAAKGHSHGVDIVDGTTSPSQGPHRENAFIRRLVHSRSTMFRNGGGIDV